MVQAVASGSHCHKRPLCLPLWPQCRLPDPRDMKIALRKWLILTHRYLGIPLSFLFLMWFASGIAMIFARGMPSLTPEMRSERLPPLNFEAVKLRPSEALEKAQLGT